MALLYDDIMAGRVGLIPPTCINDYPEALLSCRETINLLLHQLRQVQVFRINNVSKYYYESCCQRWDLLVDFPNLAPPFELMWMEYDPPNWVLELEDPKATDYTLPKVLKDARQGFWGRTGVFLQGRRTAMGFDLMSVNFNQLNADKFSNCMVGMHMGKFLLKPNGSVEDYKPFYFQGSPDFGDDPGNGIAQQYKAGTLLTLPAFLALSFMHCKNVQTLEERPEVKVSKKFQKKTGRPLTTFKVLEIESMKKVLKHEGLSESTGLKKALHICRGHFKDYRDSGLGKHHVKGLWWWSDHVRGHLSEGVVNKEYDVQAAK
jgi:hypothetical protein